MLKTIVLLSAVAFSSIALGNPNRVSECELNQRSSSCYNHGLDLMKSSKPEDKKSAMKYFSYGCKFAKQTKCSETEAKLAVRHHLLMTQPSSKLALVKTPAGTSTENRTPAQTASTQSAEKTCEEGNANDCDGKAMWAIGQGKVGSAKMYAQKACALGYSDGCKMVRSLESGDYAAGSGTVKQISPKSR